MMEHDPKAQAAWKQTRVKMQFLATLMRQMTDSPEYREAGEDERQNWQELFDALRESTEADNDELTARHFTPPQSAEDWEHLARIVEIPDKTIDNGDLKVREIFACALAWADRQTIKAKLTASAAPPPAPASTPAPAPAPAAESQTDEDEDELANIGCPVSPPYDTRVAIWAGRRIYLGNDTEVSRLFWMLARPVGRSANIAAMQRAIDGMETDPDERPEDEVRKAAQRMRKVISKLRKELHKAGLDHHVVIVKGGSQESPEYSMVSRFGK
jgi:hypothetical protein